MPKAVRGCILRAFLDSNTKLRLPLEGEAILESGPRAFTVSEVIEGRSLSRFQIGTVALCGLVVVLDGFDAQCIGFLAPAIAEDLSIPLKTFGPIFAASLIGLMLAAMGVGPIADRVGPSGQRCSRRSRLRSFLCFPRGPIRSTGFCFYDF